jgi:hypothetical protein
MKRFLSFCAVSLAVTSTAPAFSAAERAAAPKDAAWIISQFTYCQEFPETPFKKICWGAFGMGMDRGQIEEKLGRPLQLGSYEDDRGDGFCGASEDFHLGGTDFSLGFSEGKPSRLIALRVDLPDGGPSMAEISFNLKKRIDMEFFPSPKTPGEDPSYMTFNSRAGASVIVRSRSVTLSACPQVY